MTLQDQNKLLKDKARFNEALSGFLQALDEAQDDKYAWLADELEGLTKGIFNMEAEDRAHAAFDEVLKANLDKFGVAAI